MAIPKYDDFFNPLLKAMHILGGSASIAEQEDNVASILKLSEKEIAEIHKDNRTKLSYRLAWARNYLKRFGLLYNSQRGVWALTSKGQKTKKVIKTEVKKFIASLDSNESKKKKDVLEDGEISTWASDLLDLIKTLTPDAFERLCQRILRESGFTHVEVTGRSGDGGIDGKGIVRIGGLLSFHMIFQCKRWQGSVPSSVIRDFRGAMVGRTDKGLVITTGKFTKGARSEAQRDGAPPIDLVDGETLVYKLKELSLGVVIKERIVQEINLDKEFFKGI
jgi:restriction system protein